MFIFLGGDPSHLSPEAQQAHMQKWFAWVEKLTNEKRYVAGEALLPGGKTITGQKKVVTDGPFAESKEVVGGFFVVLARNIPQSDRSPHYSCQFFLPSLFYVPLLYAIVY